MNAIDDTKKVLMVELLKMLENEMSQPCKGDEGFEKVTAMYRYTLAASKVMEAVELLGKIA